MFPYGDMRQQHISKVARRAGTRLWDDVGTILGRSLPALQGRQEVRKSLCRQRKFLMRDDGVDHDDLFAAIQGANGRV